MPRWSFALLVLLGSSFFVHTLPPRVSLAANSPGLGEAASFSVLGATRVANTPTSNIGGDVGLSPAAGTNYSGLTTGEVGGTIYAVDGDGPAGEAGENPALLSSALADLDSAFSDLGGGDCDTHFGSLVKDLGGLTLKPGVYCADGFNIEGTLTLEGSSDDVWIFRSEGVETHGNSRVVFSEGGLPCNVWWRGTESSSIGSRSSIVGNIISTGDVDLGAGAAVNGRVFSLGGAVTMNTNTILGPLCSSAGSGNSKIFSKDKRCLDSTPPAISWVKIENASSSNNWRPLATWSAMGGDEMEVRFSEDPDELRWTFKTLNDGHERLGEKGNTGVLGSGNYYYQWRTINGCKKGPWSAVLSAVPGLPPAGFAPQTASPIDKYLFGILRILKQCQSFLSF